MTFDELKEKALSLPYAPGVYIMRDKSGKIIYIGKAKALKNRVVQYFRSPEKHTEKVRRMVENVEDFDYIICDSEFEALILECSLIKQNNPKYNILLKDDKGYHYIHISDEKWPRITAQKQLMDTGENIGPYYSGYAVKKAVEEADRKRFAFVNKIVAECEVLPDDARQTESTPSTETTVPDNDDKDSSETNKTNGYLSDVKDSDNRVYSNGQNKGKDKYETDPVPEGKPLPVEPEDQEVNKKNAYTCTFSIECSTILNNLDQLDPDKLELVPTNGVILPPTVVTFYEGESVFDVLQRVCRENGIHMESSWTPMYNSAYIEGIHNLYEFDCGNLSGWMYRVNGWYPNYGCSRYQLKDGDTVEWRFTCDLGNDIGGGYAVGG